MRVERKTPIESVEVVADAGGLVSRAGTALVVSLADRVGLSAAPCEALSDVRVGRSRTIRVGSCAISPSRSPTAATALRDEPALFGEVASE